MKIKPIIIILLCACLTLLSGCVRYEVGIDLVHQHRGAIVQNIKLGEQLTSFSQSEAEKWLKSLEKRTKKLGGKVKKISEQELQINIPFGNTEELASKFNQFFNPNGQNSTEDLENTNLLELTSEMKVKNSNLLLLERDYIDLTVDLRGLGVLSEQGKLIVSPGSLVDLKLRLNAPWGAKNIISDSTNSPPVSKKAKQLIWQLQPGQINHIEVIFWLPSHLGIGTVIIFILLFFAYRVKYGSTKLN